MSSIEKCPIHRSMEKISCGFYIGYPHGEAPPPKSVTPVEPKITQSPNLPKPNNMPGRVQELLLTFQPGNPKSLQETTKRIVSLFMEQSVK